MREVETKPRRLDDAACLLNMRSENLAESGVENVRCGVISHGRPALRRGDFGAQFVADVNRGERANLMDCETGDCRARVFYDGHRFARVSVKDGSAIPYLAACFPA